MNFDFSALNFETIDSNINAYPDMFLNQNGVTFTKKVLEDLGYPAFVLCLLDAKARVFAIRSCKSNEPKGFKFSKPRGEQKGVVTISNKNLLDPLRAVTGEDWIPCKRYKVRGFWVADAKTTCFDLNKGVQEDFPLLAESYPNDDPESILELICDVLCSASPTIRIGIESLPIGKVQDRFKRLRFEHVAYVLDSTPRNHNAHHKHKSLPSASVIRCTTHYGAFLRCRSEAQFCVNTSHREKCFFMLGFLKESHHQT